MPENEQRPHRDLTSTANALGGGFASTIATVLTYPFDLIRTRFQVHDGKRTNLPQYRTTLGALRHITAQEGFRGLYGGMTPAVIGASASWSMYMFGYSYVKRVMQDEGYTGISPIIVGGLVAGVTTATATNPIWVIKTRMQTQIITAPNSATHYKGVWDAATRIYREEGIKSYYRGLTPAIIASYHGAVQFLIYETMCSWWSGGPTTDPFIAFVSGGVSKVAALMSTQPLSVLKARLQEQRGGGNIGDTPKYNGALDAFTKTLRNEGIRGFYKGVGPAMWRLALHSAMFFSILEHTKTYLRRFESMNLK